MIKAVSTVVEGMVGEGVNDFTNYSEGISKSVKKLIIDELEEYV